MTFILMWDIVAWTSGRRVCNTVSSDIWNVQRSAFGRSAFFAFWAWLSYHVLRLPR